MLLVVEELFDCKEDLKNNEDAKTCKEKLENPAKNKCFEIRKTSDIAEMSEVKETFKARETVDIADTPEIKGQIANFDEVSVIEAELLGNEENQMESKNNFSDEESQLEKDLFDWEFTDTDKEDTIETSTFTERVQVKIRKPKKRTSSATGYKHKQPRVTSPLLHDFTCAICQSVIFFILS